MGDKINELIEFLFPTRIEEEKKENAQIIIENTETRTDGYPARCPASGDKVYFIKGLKKSWVKNLETLQKLGYDLHKVVNIKNEEMDGFETIEPTDLKVYETQEVPETQENADAYKF